MSGIQPYENGLFIHKGRVGNGALLIPEPLYKKYKTIHGRFHDFVCDWYCLIKTVRELQPNKAYLMYISEEMPVIGIHNEDHIVLNFVEMCAIITNENIATWEEIACDDDGPLLQEYPQT